MGTEDALVFTTGYLANIGAIGTLLEPGDTVICDSGDHASILDAVSMSRARIRPFRHNRLDKLETMLERAEADGGGVLVVVDGVFSMEGDVAPLPDVAALCREHGARLMVDEAHGVGVLGARGAGACELFGVEDEVDLRMGTFSKSLASCGGFIAGPPEVIDFLRVQSRSFMFTAAAVPAAVGAALGALRIIRSDEGPQLMAKLLDNARYLHDGLAELGYRGHRAEPAARRLELITPIVPVLVGDDWKAVLLWKALYDAGVYVNVAIYPAVQRGGALLRTSVMATHEREHLDRALEIFERVKGEVEGRCRRLRLPRRLPGPALTVACRAAPGRVDAGGRRVASRAPARGQAAVGGQPRPGQDQEQADHGAAVTLSSRIATPSASARRVHVRDHRGAAGPDLRDQAEEDQERERRADRPSTAIDASASPDGVAVGQVGEREREQEQGGDADRGGDGPSGSASASGA